ncbi:formylglycine-generating enzyme family protein [Mastigocoleus sp. MO_188.B34]|uniref:formylglycine-generating enzyme family protein n=1 Tax=Mastigocoleus sp. MO_188.B34 TaxID=3036635 RepID=UPI00260AACB0|nr:formylglycine-generating enzyme family protein [Mastigocoleus sp. MO_188.B34]MDJ0698167.1 formylglycine-generating enzyme family protein [Mastigocoleus sp. MO_188.B34]
MEKPVIQYDQGTAQYFVEDLGNDVELEMVLIPSGTFTMGAPKDEKDSRESERPQHQVKVPAFFMGKYPITQAQWKAVAALDQVKRDLEADPSRFKGNNLPVERVSWYGAVEFCTRLSQYSNRSYRLPSEAEWEYACRAGTTTPFHFGEKITSELANYDPRLLGFIPDFEREYRGRTTPVGSFGVANAFGLYDMHGNVWEWCLDDWHSNYEAAPTDGSAWLYENNNLYKKTSHAVLRGGSWFGNSRSCRSAYRYEFNWLESGFIFNTIGFRVVCAFGNSFQ